MPVVVPDGRLAGMRLVLRMAQTPEAQVAEQPSLHHQQAEPVRDGADEGLPDSCQTNAVVHQIVDGRRNGSPQRQHVAQAVQQDGRLRDGHHQAEQSQPGQRAHAGQSPGLGTGKVFLTGPRINSIAPLLVVITSHFTFL